MIASAMSGSLRAGVRAYLLAAAVGMAATLLDPPAVEALSDNCRELTLDGAAGASSTDQLVLRVVAKSGLILSESCELTIQSQENAVEFLRRMPWQWGNGKGGKPTDIVDTGECKVFCTEGPIIGTQCTDDADCDVGLLKGVCGIEEKKSCGQKNDFSLRSCRAQVKISQKSGKCFNGNPATSSLKGCKRDKDCPAGETCPTHPDTSRRVRACDDLDPLVDLYETCLKKPPVLRVCCKESDDCTGAKLGTTDLNEIEVTMQTKLDPTPLSPELCDLASPFFCPSSLPGPGSEPRTIVVDPVGVVQTPYRAVADCREALRDAQAEFTKVVFGTLASCHRSVLAGSLSADCNSVNPTSDLGAAIAGAEGDLRTAIAEGCGASTRSPFGFGFRACPRPCGSIDIGVCSAGMVGSPCQRDADCDSVPSAGDGRCGDWSTVADCQVCLGTAAGVDAIQRAYGTTAPPAPPDAAGQACQNDIGATIASRLAVTLDVASRCQKKVDAAKLLLPEATPKCGDADSKGRRALAEIGAAAELALNCPLAALGQLNTCASNLAGLRKCTREVVQRTTRRVADATSPEQICGDGKVGTGEKCDDGNDVDGDGCDSNCTPTGCRNKIKTAGEECDDGNAVAGDGCSPGCTAEQMPCVAQTCSTYTFDCSPLFPGECLCLQSVEGGGSCVNNFDCATAPSCVQTSGCPPGNVCYVNTCCSGGKCGPPTCTGQ